MKKLMTALAGAMLIAGAANAQYHSDAFWRGAPDSPHARIQFLQDRIDHGIADGSLSRGEADHANHELAGIRHWIADMHWNDDGALTPDQRARVETRLDRLSSQIHWMRHNGW